jgi:hypothetical protein
VEPSKLFVPLLQRRDVQPQGGVAGLIDAGSSAPSTKRLQIKAEPGLDRRVGDGRNPVAEFEAIGEHGGGSGGLIVAVDYNQHLGFRVPQRIGDARDGHLAHRREDLDRTTRPGASQDAFGKRGDDHAIGIPFADDEQIGGRGLRRLRRNNAARGVVEAQMIDFDDARLLCRDELS